MAPLRVVVGEDDVLLREGIVRLLREAGVDVVAQAGDAVDLLRRALAHHPDVVIVDVQMPPDHDDDGLRAALELRRTHPDIGVLVLSQFYEQQYALDLIGDRAQGVGYLLKERVGDVSAFIDAVERVAAGGSALDPEVVGRMLGRRRPGAQRPRARRARRDGRGQVQPRHRRGAGRHAGRRREARHEHLPEAGARQQPHRAPSRAGRAHVRARVAVALSRDRCARRNATRRATKLIPGMCRP
jgi:DNA-binding NarL/FixJ family response regulator